MGFHLLDKGDEASAFTQIVMKMLNGFAGIIVKLSNSIEKMNSKLPELLVMIMYTVGHFTMMIYHEPWFDEAEAWQITRCASLKELFFQVPHYEGHTPLWDLILLPFAKGGAPFELSLSIVSFLFAGTAVALILWKSPFPRIIRMIIPFTYFFFYQYGVISRPYCVMMLAFALMGMFYKNRNAKPLPYILSLMLLAITFPAGMLIAGCITAIWLIDVLEEVDIKNWLKDKRLILMLALFVVAVMSLIQIMPNDYTYATHSLTEDKGNIVIIKLVYTLLALPSEVLVTNAWWDQGKLSNATFNNQTLIVACILGMAIWCALYFYGKSRKMLGILFVPYVAFALFSSFVYMSCHHMGIALLFFMFWLWAAAGEEAGKDTTKLATRDKEALKSCVVVIGLCCMVMSLAWTVLSCITDITSDYAVGREEAIFIRENHLDKYNIFAEYEINYDEGNNVSSYDLNYTYFTPNVLAYMDDNIFYNMNVGYVEHRRLTSEEQDLMIEELKLIKPDVLFGVPDIANVYGNCDEYTLVYSKAKKRAWKSIYELMYQNIYVRDDLLKETGLKELKHVRTEYAPEG